MKHSEDNYTNICMYISYIWYKPLWRGSAKWCLDLLITLSPTPYGATMSRWVPRETLLPLRHVWMLAYMKKIEQEKAREQYFLVPIKAKPDLFNHKFIIFRLPFAAKMVAIAVEPRWKGWILMAASLIWFLSSPCTSLPQVNSSNEVFEVVSTDPSFQYYSFLYYSY